MVYILVFMCRWFMPNGILVYAKQLSSLVLLHSLRATWAQQLFLGICYHSMYKKHLKAVQPLVICVNHYNLVKFLVAKNQRALLSYNWHLAGIFYIAIGFILALVHTWRHQLA